ncbi:MAG: Fic family protein [Thermincolia bacterium]
MYDLLIELREESCNFRQQFGELPDGVLENDIWKSIWSVEIYHSLAMEGNPLNTKEIYMLIQQEKISGTKEVWHHLEAQGYANTARWVYENAVEKETGLRIPMSVELIKYMHKLLVGPLRSEYPAASGEELGEWRTASNTKGCVLLKPSPASEIPESMENLVDEINRGPKEGEFVIEFAGRIHAKLLKIAPFGEGNSQIARLLMNYLLIQRGYPPTVILKIQKVKYIRALEKANQAKPDYSLLTLLLARSIRESFSKLALMNKMPVANEVTPQMQELELLKDLAQRSPYKANYLRTLAEGGKLKAIKNEEGNWFSTEEYLKEYIDSRTRRGRRPKPYLNNANKG